VFVVVGKVFGVLRTQRDPETGVYHVLSAAEQSQPTTISSPTAGTDRDRFKNNSREYFVLDDMIGLTLNIDEVMYVLQHINRRER
jgi:hypothetical protein